jgi:hypothetical protein
VVDVVFIGVVSLSLLVGFAIWHVLKLRSGQQEIAHGFGQAFTQIIQRLEVVEAIPEVLKDLNLGGVTLQPNKNLGEIVLEAIMGRITGGVKTTPPFGGPWPHEEKPEHLEDVNSEA